jgi:hypothetical protein
VGHQDEAELSDQDLEVLEAYSGGTAFLQNLDQKAISQYAHLTHPLGPVVKLLVQE